MITCRLLVIMLTLLPHAYAMSDAYLESLREELENRTLRVEKEYNFRQNDMIISAALLCAQANRYLILYQSNQTLSRYPLYTDSFAHENVHAYQFFYGAPLLIEYSASTAREDAAVRKVVRYLISSNRAELAFEEYTVSTKYAYAKSIPTFQMPAGYREADERKQKAKTAIARGNNAFNDGDYKAAIRAYRNALAIDFNNHIAHNNIGYAYAKTGQYNNAEQEYIFALAQNLFFLPTYTNLLSLYRRVGNDVGYEHVLRKMEALENASASDDLPY